MRSQKTTSHRRFIELELSWQLAMAAQAAGPEPAGPGASELPVTENLSVTIIFLVGLC